MIGVYRYAQYNIDNERKETTLMNEYILKTDSISKHYGGFAANEKISVNIKKGSIYGLVGRNGAGKTTFMKMICSLSSPTSGGFELCGKSFPQLGSARTKIGNLIEDPGIYANMSAYDNLKAKAKLYGKVDKQKINDLLETVGLAKAGKKPAGKFSLGMKQRLGIGLALIGDPEMLVLDEPINGLDPAGVAEIRETLQKLKEKYNLYIVSNCQSGYIEAFLTFYGFGKYIDDIECYGNNNLIKGDNIRLVADRNHLDKAVYVGDIQGDYDSSVEAGVKFIHAAYGFGSIVQQVPVINEFSELPDVAENVFNSVGEIPHL